MSSHTLALLAAAQCRGEKHVTNAKTYPGPPLFVADTMTRVKNYNLPINNNNKAGCVPCTALVNHAPPAVSPHRIGCAPINKKLAQKFVSTPSPSEARKVGNFHPTKIPLIYKVGSNFRIGC
jgi:hypothetical protein